VRSGPTDPYVVHEPKTKLDSQVLYDTQEVERVAGAAMRGMKAKPSDLDAARVPVASRLLASFAQA
jgi:hypothetical protein